MHADPKRTLVKELMKLLQGGIQADVRPGSKAKLSPKVWRKRMLK